MNSHFYVESLIPEERRQHRQIPLHSPPLTLANSEVLSQVRFDQLSSHAG